MLSFYVFRVIVGHAPTVEILKHADHEHPPAPEEGIALQAYAAMKRKAEEHPEVPPAQLIRHDLPQVLVNIRLARNFKILGEKIILPLTL